MALTPLEQDVVSRGAQAASKVIYELKPIIDSLNILYDSQGGAKETISQPELDAVSSFSGLTKTQLDDGMYVLTSTLRTAINSAYAQLAELAARA
jgi:hypothetical protein